MNIVFNGFRDGFRHLPTASSRFWTCRLSIVISRRRISFSPGGRRIGRTFHLCAEQERGDRRHNLEQQSARGAGVGLLPSNYKIFPNWLPNTSYCFRYQHRRRYCWRARRLQMMAGVTRGFVPQICIFSEGDNSGEGKTYFTFRRQLNLTTGKLVRIGLA